jgi:adenosine deaminase
VNLRSLPKIDLHRHLEGSVRFETFVELAREVRIDLSTRELRRRTTMRGERPGFARFLSKFELYRGLYPSREWIERVAFEAAEDAKKDGVVYLELRFSPTHFGRRLKAKGEDVAGWVAKGARRAGIDLSLVATFGREFGPEGNGPTTRAVEGTDFFSGLDLAGDESVSAMPFLSLFKRLKLPVTVHAGEAGAATNVREAVERFGARRIGHGVRILHDPAFAKRCGSVTFEVCPTSEIHTGAAPSWRRHPVKRMVEAGLRVTLNSDDPSISEITLGGEIRSCLRAGLSPSDIKKSMARAAEAAFLPASRRRELARTIERSW